MGFLFGPVFLIGAAALALWIDARFPELAPRSLGRRVLAAAAAVLLLELAPFVDSPTMAAYASLFALLLPAFVAAFLTAVWLLRAVGEAWQRP